ncbi:MAG: hypothetical protein LGL72_07985 [Acidibrevibacterium sp.]|uniref:hypothetical protein n=1 Tax=Acidibrevibacterium fodinaquatile TaxID=1969806 RepID=UPI0023A900AA|nr:hypothetical protein [Acidibrevibacterium fodinaquatile]MCA7119333.1 hypothetical protein [Acidibrevibacterium fodinaquatile]
MSPQSGHSIWPATGQAGRGESANKAELREIAKNRVILKTAKLNRPGAWTPGTLMGINLVTLDRFAPIWRFAAGGGGRRT